MVGVMVGALIMYKLFFSASKPVADESYYGEDGGLENLGEMDRDALIEKLRAHPMEFRDKLMKRPLRGREFMSKLSDKEKEKMKGRPDGLDMESILANAPNKDRKFTDLLEKKRKHFNQFGEGPIFNALNEVKGEKKLSPQEIAAAKKNLS